MEWKEARKTKRWRAKYGEHYWYVSDKLIPYNCIERLGDRQYCGGDEERYNIGNYFRTKEEAQQAAEVVRKALQKFHEQNAEK